MSQMERGYREFYHKWVILHSILNLTGVITSFFLAYDYLWAILVVVSFVIYVSKIDIFVGRLPLMIGYANWVSLFRLMIVLIVLLFHDELSSLVIATCIFTSIAMDGLDGYLARRFKQSSKVGENLDMEIDAFMVLILCYIHVADHDMNWLVLIPGALKYIYEISLFWLEQKNEELLSKRVRSTIAVVFFISLVIPFVFNPDFNFLIYVAGGAIVISFLISFYSQLKR